MPDRTHAQMTAIVSNGASVMLNSKAVVATHAHLPSAATLAINSGDVLAKQEAKEAAKRKAIEAAAELAALEAAEAHEEKDVAKPALPADTKTLSSPPATTGKGTKSP